MADVLHHTAHAAHPEWDGLADDNVELALATRRQLLAELAKRAVPVFAAHISAAEPLLVEADRPGIRHVAFAIEDIDAVVADLRARGAELVGELERYRGQLPALLRPRPGGIIIELAEQIG